MTTIDLSPVLPHLGRTGEELAEALEHCLAGAREGADVPAGVSAAPASVGDNRSEAKPETWSWSGRERQSAQGMALRPPVVRRKDDTTRHEGDPTKPHSPPHDLVVHGRAKLHLLLPHLLDLPRLPDPLGRQLGIRTPRDLPVPIEVGPLVFPRLRVGSASSPKTPESDHPWCFVSMRVIHRIGTSEGGIRWRLEVVDSRRSRICSRRSCASLVRASLRVCSAV